MSISKEEITSRVQKIVAKQLYIDVRSVTPEKSFVADLGADSLDTIELIMALENEFGFEIPDDKAESITTVKAAVEYAEQALNA